MEFKLSIVLIILSGSFEFGHMYGDSVDCSSYISCSECTLRASCGWETGNGVCSSMDTGDLGDNWITETPGCPGKLIHIDDAYLTSFTVKFVTF